MNIWNGEIDSSGKEEDLLISYLSRSDRGVAAAEKEKKKILQFQKFPGPNSSFEWGLTCVGAFLSKTEIRLLVKINPQQRGIILVQI